MKSVFPLGGNWRRQLPGQAKQKRRKLLIESLEMRRMLFGVSWTNVLNPINADNDNSNSPLDALVIINEINQPRISGPGGVLPVAGDNGKAPPPYIDVDCDSRVSPLDVLTVINVLNGGPTKPTWQFDQFGGNGQSAGTFSAAACSPMLHEGNSFVTTLSSEVTIPANSNYLTFEYSSLNFDVASKGRSLDAFEAALLDSQGNSLVPTLSSDRDSFFNIAEGLPVAKTNGVLQESNKISLSITDVLPGTKARLVLRLVNNDGDTESSVIVPAIRFENLNLRPADFSFPGLGSSTGSQGDVDSKRDADIGSKQPITPVDLSTLNAVMGRPVTTRPTDSSGVSDSKSSPPAVDYQPAFSGSRFETRGKEFWIGFPDNLFEGNNRPQKVLYITGDIATTGFVEIPGLIDPATSLPFRADFVVNAGEVTAIDLPSQDVGDDSDNDTDFDVEVELIGRIQKKGIHVVAQEPVAVYGLDLAVSTSDAFMALPIDSLGTEYINLGYENTYSFISHVEGTQFLVVATQDNTQVSLTPGKYSGSTNVSNAQIRRPNGTIPFGLGNSNGLDIGPYVTDVAGNFTLEVSPPYPGYSGKYDFELIDVATAAVPASFDEKVTVHFSTGRETRVVSFDVLAGQQLYYDAINPSPPPNVNVRLISASGELTSLASQSDNNSFVNLFGALSFRETGKYYVMITGEQNTAFDFSFRLVDMSMAPQLSMNTDYSATVNPPGRAELYRLQGTAGQVLWYDSLNQDRLVGFTVLGVGGNQVFNTNAADDHVFVLPDSGTYYVILDSASFAPSSFGFRLIDLHASSVLPMSVPTTSEIATGHQATFRFSGVAGQTFSFDIQNAPLSFRASFQLLDPSGNSVTLNEAGNKRSAKLATNGTYSLLIGAITVHEGGNITLLPTLINDSVVPKSGFNSIQTLTVAAGGNATYTFTAPAGTRVLVDSLNTSTANLYVELNAPDGTRLFTGFGFANDTQDIPRFGPAFLPQSGMYTLTVRGNTTADFGSYRFRIVDLDSAGVPLTLGNVIDGDFPTGREVLVYTLDANVGDQLLFDARSGSYIFGIYDPSLNAIYSRGIFGSASTNEADGVGKVTLSGRHYVVFQGDPSVPQNFSFQIQNLKVAPLLAIGTEAVGSVSGNGQVVYRMPLTAGQRVRFDNLLPYAGEVNYRISNSGGRILFESGFQNVDSGPPGTPLLHVSESGEYFVSIQSRRTTPANYRFRIEDLSTTAFLSFDADIEVNLNPGNAARIFRIDAQAGQTIQLDNLGTAAALTWQITGPTTQFLGGSNDSADFTATIQSTGIHYLSISGRQDSGPITFRFRATRTSGPSVPLVGFNTPVSLNVGPYETKPHTFSAPTGRLIYVNVLDSVFSLPSQTITLNRGETYLLRDTADTGLGRSADLTGSVISSTKPVAVFGGNRAAFIPSQFFAADHLVEQLPPTNTWGREFITLPLATNSDRGDRFRMLSQADGTQVSINGNVVATLNRGEFHEQVIVGASQISSNKPILVAQYAHSQNYYQASPGGNPNFLGDPLMMIVPPYEQFLANYTVSTPAVTPILSAQRFDRNFINIVAPDEAVGLIEIDGVPIPRERFVTIGNSGFSGVQQAVELGAYNLAGPLPFGVFVYGFGSFDSYGYVGGQSLSPIVAASSIVLTPANANPQVNDELVLTARVADLLGAPLQGIRVDFDVSGVNPQRGFEFSDANGLVSFVYTGQRDGRDVVTASVGQLLDDSIIDWRTGAVPPALTIIAPADGDSVVAGSTLVASGSALADFPLATLDVVTVNGSPLSSLDAAGNFFVSLLVGPGDNEFEFTAIDSTGKSTSKVITLRGVQRTSSEIDFSQFSDITGSFLQKYARSSFHQNDKVLIAEVAIENTGQYPADVPLLVGVKNVSDPLVLVRNIDGMTPDGIPYYDFTRRTIGGTLNPKSLTGFVSAQFYNPNQTPFTYDFVFYGKLNQAPEIQSVPRTEADLNTEYRYDVLAVDPNGDSLTYELIEAPAGMSIDLATGRILWTPGSSESGLHTINIRVSDSRLGESFQRFVLSARPKPANRTPVFDSIPLAVAEVGVAYPYVVRTSDADGDNITYQLVSAPSGMTIQSTGEIAWVPALQQLGLQTVVIAASDGRGGVAEQAFSLQVFSPKNNMDPVIVSSPLNAVKVGLITHQVIALDADAEALSYRLIQGPSGMTLNSTGLIQWNPSIAQVGPHAFHVEVLDARGGRTVQKFSMAVFDNADPVITSSSVTSASVGAKYIYQVTASDAIDDVLSFRLISAPVGMTIHQSTGLIQWEVPANAHEMEQVTIGVGDGRGGMALQMFTITVSGGQQTTSNSNPLILSTPPTIATIGSQVNYSVRARDPDGNPLTFDLPLAPDGMVIDATSGQLGWLPRAEQSGTQQVVIRVQDNQGGICLQAFQIQVDASNTSPVITSSPNTNATVAQVWEYRIQAQDTDNDLLIFEVVSPISGVTISQIPNGDADAVLRFTPNSAGSTEVVIAVSDLRGGRVEQRFSLTATSSNVNVAPIIHSVPRLEIPAGQTWTYMVSAEDPNADPISLHLTSAPNDLKLESSTRILSWTPTATQMGVHPVVLRVDDGRGGITSQSFQLVVTEDSENHTPRIVSPPSAFRATLGEEFAYDMRAEDVDGDPVEWTLVEAPHGASLDRRYGTLRWQPSAEQLGNQRFVVSASDPIGMESTQSFSLLVSGSNLAPSIVSRPLSEAIVDERYVYGVRAIDPENDALSFRLLQGPQGMTIDKDRGILRWTPHAGQIGTATVVVEVSDIRGNSSKQVIQVAVSNVVRNAEPIITSRASFRARVDAVYQYDVNAVDPEGKSIAFSLLTAPQGMQIDASSGMITWTPTSAQVGSHLVQVAAIDSQGGRGVQRFAILVRINQAPVITSLPATSVAMGEKYRYDLQVHDAERDPLVFEMLSAPAGMRVDELGRVVWQTAPGVPSSNSVVLRVTDSFGAVATQSFSLSVTPDSSAPKVEVRLSSNPLRLGENTVVLVQASDNVGIVDVRLTMNGQPLVLNGERTVTLRGEVAGLYVLRAIARDTSGNEGVDEVTLRVFDPADTRGPTININSPQPNSRVTQITDIVGSIVDDNLQYYRVEYGRADSVDVNLPEANDPDYRTIATGNANAVDKVLATFDPTMLINDDYVIRVLAGDLTGNLSAKTIPLSLDGQLKLGEFQLSFTDLTIPVAGIPISVTRSYDSRNANIQGEFGYGWTLSISNPQIRETIPVSGFEKEGLSFGATPFREGTKVYLTNPEGRRVGFTFRPTRQVSLFGGGSYAPTFVPDPGVYDKLDVGSVPLRKIGDAFYSGFFGDPFNPSSYRLTTKNGMVYEYGQFSGLDNVTDRNGNRLEYRPDGIFSSAGPSIQFVRDYLGRIKSVIDPAGNSIQYDYSANGNLIAYTDQSRSTTRYTYVVHLLDTIIDPRGVKTLDGQFDAMGRLVGSQDALGNTVTQSYETGQRIVSSKDANGNTSTSRFDVNGNVIEEVDPLGNMIRYEYMDANNPFLKTKVVDPRGGVTRYTYDLAGNTIGMTDAQGGQWSWVFDDLGNELSSSDPAGRVTSSVYNQQGRLVQFVSPTGSVNSVSYDSLGRPTVFRNAGSSEATYAYVGSNALASEVIAADGSRISMEYDDLGFVTLYREGVGTETKYVRDSVGRVLSEKHADGSESTTVYDANGNTVEIIDAIGNRTKFEYDTNNRVIARIDSKQNRTTYAYDANGNKVRETDRNGRTKTFAYDANNRLIQEKWLEGTRTSNVIQWTYDAAQNVTSVSDDFSEIHYTFDLLNRVGTARSLARGGVSLLLEYQYDAVGNVVQVRDNTGTAVHSSYTNHGDLKSRNWQTVTGDDVAFSYEYDARSIRQSIDRLARGSVNANVGSTRIDLDPVGRAKSIVHRGPTGATLIDFEISFDRTLRVSEERRNGVASVFSYDRTNQVKSVRRSGNEVEWYVYDSNGNRLGSYVHGNAYETGPLNQMRSDGIHDYSYDNQGNMISKLERASNIKSSFQYDHRNRLVEVEKRAGTGQVIQRVRFEYDVFDRRVAIEVNGVITRRFGYDNNSLWVEYNSDNVVARRYLFGNALDEIIAQSSPEKGVEWYLSDRQGSIVAVLDNHGNAIQQIAYDAFGKPELLGGTQSVPTFAYIGREFDLETGLYYFRARYYDPMIGRFLSEDPLGFEAGDTNLYRYAFNNPLNLADPTGLNITEQTELEDIIARLSFQLSRVGKQEACLGFVRDAVEVAVASLEPHWLIYEAAQTTLEAMQCIFPGPRFTPHTLPPPPLA